MTKKQILPLILLFSTLSFSQIKINGAVYSEYLEPFYNAVIKDENGNKVTSDKEGKFFIRLKNKFPQKITVSSTNYENETIIIEKEDQEINVVLKESLTINQIVVSASRIPERIIESPVSIERIGLHNIKNKNTNSLFDTAAKLNGVSLRRNDYGFQSINTRGFSDFTNSRFVQLVDGADISTVALSFSQGNYGGLNELDIESIEILPGASSALYGANAYNGLMLIKTKNPFEHSGITAQFKSGFFKEGKRPIYDVSLRMAHEFNNSFAAKVTFNYQKAPEWIANDSRNIDTWSTGNKELIEGENTTYDGINLYGDDKNLLQYGNVYTTRTGYKETEILKEPNNKAVKFSGALYFRPFTNKKYEIIFGTSLSLSDYISQTYQNRYLVNDYGLSQTKLEFKGENFFVRGYYNKVKTDKIYDLSEIGHLVNQSYSKDEDWVKTYSTEYNNYDDLEKLKKQVEKTEGRYNSGTREFNNAITNAKKKLITEGGSRLSDNSSFIHFDGNYNFKKMLNNWIDFQVGGSYRKYNTDSNGTIFNDLNENIKIEEYGVYSQLQKKLFNEKLKITGAFRYDKSENFVGAYSPRLSMNYSLGKNKNHVLRVSYQTGFRNPTMQEQYDGTKSGAHINIGTAEDNLDKFKLIKKIQDYDNNIARFGTEKEYTRESLLDNAVLTQSVWNQKGSELKRIKKSDYSAVNPETVQTIELGYRSLIPLNNRSNLDVSINGFYSKHKDFTFYQDIVSTNYGNAFYEGQKATDKKPGWEMTPGEIADHNYFESLPNPWYPYKFVKDDKYWTADFDFANALYYEGDYQLFYFMTNAKSKINSYGFGVNISTKTFGNTEIGVGYNFIDYEMEDNDYGTFEPNFNTAKHTVKGHLGNENIYKNIGFGVNATWTDKYRWVSPFVKGEIPVRTIVDAQLSYKIPSIKSKFEIGGTNLLGKEYNIGLGAGEIGQIYYVSWIINQ